MKADRLKLQIRKPRDQWDIGIILNEQVRQVRWLYNNSNKCTKVYDEKFVRALIQEIKERINEQSKIVHVRDEEVMGFTQKHCTYPNPCECKPFKGCTRPIESFVNEVERLKEAESKVDSLTIRILQLTIVSLEEQIKQLESKAEILQKFKDYVHKRLDDAEIEKDPESPHKEAGCRIGARLDIVLGKLSEQSEGQDQDEIWKEVINFVRKTGGGPIVLSMTFETLKSKFKLTRR